MFRAGLGCDAHRFDEGRSLVLGGVRMEHDKGLIGHSDADACLHAVTDAILGAIAAGDIGEHFDDTDPRWKDADSSVFVRHAIGLAREKGLRVANCDVTVIMDAPKLGERKKQMAANIAELLGVAPDAVCVKATTTEGMGFTGRGEGVAALAVVMLTDE